MTPLEAVCRAMRDSEPGMEEKSWRYWLPSARAALLALAECDLPDEAIDEAEEARIEAIEAHRKHQAEIWANIGKPIPDNAKGTAAFTWMPPAFKALIRSIATEGKDND